jgi:metal-dependent HD superfamily phosphatase/phosphodiesterase
MTSIDLEVTPDAGDRGRTPDERYADRILMTVPDRHNPKLRNVIRLANQDEDLYGLSLASNVTDIERQGMTDHGPVHVKIVMNIGVRMLRLLMDADVDPSIVVDYGLTREDAEVIVALAGLLHDVGMSIHRDDHESYSLFLAERKLREILPQIYEPRDAIIIRGEVLHAIIAHRAGGRPLTLEAGVVRIADALDMAKGRSRIPFDAGSASIHSISAAAIEAVHIEPGEAKPICLRIELSNSAGVFQLDKLLRDKLRGSGLEPYLEISAELEGETEKRIFREFRI